MARGALTRCYAYAILYLLQSKTSSSTYSGANVTSISQKNVRSVLLLPVHSSGI